MHVDTERLCGFSEKFGTNDNVQFVTVQLQEVDLI